MTLASSTPTSEHRKPGSRVFQEPAFTWSEAAIAIAVTLLLLVITDALLRLWHPNPTRLPQEFSATYLDRRLDDLRGRSPIVFVGDSVLWGYKLPADESAPSVLQRLNPGLPFANLAYEGGSEANSAVVLRLLLLHDIRPRLVVLNLNVKEFNAADSAYKRLYPAVERAAASILTRRDRALLTMEPSAGMNGEINDAVESLWALYAMRTDIRESLFGASDASTAASDLLKRLDGTAAREAALHVPTPDKFLGTYDLTPIDEHNVEQQYFEELLTLCRQRHIPLLVFLTPTNHKLLHDYIDVPDYGANLAHLTATALRSGAHVLNFDRAIPAQHFLDNDHLDATGNLMLARLLDKSIEEYAK